MKQRRNKLKYCILLMMTIVLILLLFKRTDNLTPIERVEKIQNDSDYIKGFPQPPETSKEKNTENLYKKVQYVVDGDTFVVDNNGEDVTVRLIGVDAPESVNPDDNKNCEEGKQASDFLKEYLKDCSVYLTYDVESKDKYNRDLCYAYRVNSDGSVEVQTVQETLLSNGLARTMEVSPNTKMAEYFCFIEENAIYYNVGFWGSGYFSK